jgi:hypothetical protein
VVTLVKNKTGYLLSIQACLINESHISAISLFDVALAIQQQIESIYNVPELKLSTKIDILPLYQYTLKQLSKYTVVVISDKVTNNNAAEAFMFDALIKVNAQIIPDVLSRTNTRTIPHELGHLLGWDHPHGKNTYPSVNEKAHPLEQQITEQERATNLMCQTWYVQRTGGNPNSGTKLTQQQLQLLDLYYGQGKLNRHRTLRKRFTGWQWREQP